VILWSQQIERIPSSGTGMLKVSWDALPGQQVCPGSNSVYPYFERCSCFAQQVIYPITVTSACMLD